MLCPKTVLITGSNRGIGLELVKQFLKLKPPPTNLFAACRSPENAKVSQSFFRALILSTDAVQMLKFSHIKEWVRIVGWAAL